MQKFVRILLGLTCAAAVLCQASAQTPGTKSADPTSKAGTKDYSQSSIVIRMMAFDKNHDGKLTKDEITDARLHRLFDRADVNKDAVVTKEELMALAAQLDAEYPQRGGRGGFGGPGGDGNPEGFGGPGGPGGRGRGRFGGRGGPNGPGGPGPGEAGPGRFGGPGDSGPGGFGGPGGGGPGRFGGPPRPGQILPRFLQEELNLSAQQKKQLEELQKDVDSRLGKILTEDQKKQLQEMRRGFGPGGPPPDGPPPDGQAPGERGRRAAEVPVAIKPTVRHPESSPRRYVPTRPIRGPVAGVRCLAAGFCPRGQKPAAKQRTFSSGLCTRANNSAFVRVEL